MAEKWSTVIRGVLLRGDFFAGSQTAVKNLYASTKFDDQEITKSGAEFSFLAITDSLLYAMTMILEAIGENEQSPFRAWFASDILAVQSGDMIPTTVNGGGERYGRIGQVYDPTTDQYLTFQPRSLVQISRQSHGRLVTPKYHYWTDHTYIVHSVDAVDIQCVGWNKQTERANVVANDTSDCPLPEALLPALEMGTLSFIHKDIFNTEQSGLYYNMFLRELMKYGLMVPKRPELDSRGEDS